MPRTPYNHTRPRVAWSSPRVASCAQGDLLGLLQGNRGCGQSPRAIYRAPAGAAPSP